MRVEKDNLVKKSSFMQGESYNLADIGASPSNEYYIVNSYPYHPILGKGFYKKASIRMVA
jgi:hypothetical protein